MYFVTISNEIIHKIVHHMKRRLSLFLTETHVKLFLKINIIYLNLKILNL